MRYQSTPEKEFDGDIIITDPCYIIRNENGITKNDWHYCDYIMHGSSGDEDIDKVIAKKHTQNLHKLNPMPAYGSQP